MTPWTTWTSSVLARRDVWGRAPSAHNTQPWLVTESDGFLRVGWDEDRRLHVGDPERRDLMLSLGAVVESLVITAADLGHALEVAWDIDLVSRSAATLTRVAGPPATTWSVGELVNRRTARSAFEEPFAGADEVARVAAHANARLDVVEPTLVARLLPLADRWTFDGPAAAELGTWLRLSPRDPRYREDGLTDRALELSRLEALGLRLALLPPVLAVLRRTGATRLLGSSATARPTGTVVMLTGPAGLGPAGIAELGRALLRLWLGAGREGLSCHPLSQLIDCPRTAAELPAGAGREPVVVFRLGRPRRPAPRSGRLGDLPTLP